MEEGRQRWPSSAQLRRPRLVDAPAPELNRVLINRLISSRNVRYSANSDIKVDIAFALLLGLMEKCYANEPRVIKRDQCGEMYRQHTWRKQ